MKSLAVCVLSIVSMFSASASTTPSAQLLSPDLIAPAVHAAKEMRVAVESVSTGAPDSLLMVTLASALIALQLRRRQKSLRSPRLAIVSS